MAERDELQKRYAYQEMSNKVQQADRSLLRSVRSEPTGEVETLWGRKDAGRMGDRISSLSSSRPADLEEKLRKKKAKTDAQKRIKQESGASARRSGESILTESGGQTILDLGNLEGYQPSNSISREAYEHMLVSSMSC